MRLARGIQTAGYPAPMRKPEALSPLAAALERVGDRWSLHVIDALLDGPRRFGDIQTGVSGIAPNILSQRLKHLERERLIVARLYQRRPPRFIYELTAPGRDLAGVLRLLAQWGARVGGSRVGDLPQHTACGTPVEARWYCPTCARTIGDDESAEMRFL